MANVAGLPKANIHYYYGTKADLYIELLRSIVTEWGLALDSFTAEAEPKQAVGDYVRAKLDFSRRRPCASKLFATEILAGAPRIERAFTEHLTRLLEGKAAVLDQWGASGRICKVDGRHYFMMLWAMTQHYADFDYQVRVALGKDELDDDDWANIERELVTYALRMLGI